MERWGSCVPDDDFKAGFGDVYRGGGTLETGLGQKLGVRVPLGERNSECGKEGGEGLKRLLCRCCVRKCQTNGRVEGKEDSAFVIGVRAHGGGWEANKDAAWSCVGPCAREESVRESGREIGVKARYRKGYIG